MRFPCFMLISLMLLSGCNLEDGGSAFTHPRPWGLGKTPEGSPLFQEGWNDGCDTGLGVYGGATYRRKDYRFKQDLTQLDNPEYYRAWKDAYTYCRWYVWNWSRGWHGAAISTAFD